MRLELLMMLLGTLQLVMLTSYSSSKMNQFSMIFLLKELTRCLLRLSFFQSCYLKKLELILQKSGIYLQMMMDSWKKICFSFCYLKSSTFKLVFKVNPLKFIPTTEYPELLAQQLESMALEVCLFFQLLLQKQLLMQQNQRHHLKQVYLCFLQILSFLTIFISQLESVIS